MSQLKKNFTPFIAVLLIILFSSSEAFAFGAWWQCHGKKGGEWNFGRTPSTCLVDHMQKQSFVKKQYSTVIFNDRLKRGSERKRYMTELSAALAESGEYYIRRRKPGVSTAEVQAFVRALRTLVHQETYWSHYRKAADNRVRYMRGDSGHGHGIMQVDDRSHQSALLKGKGADFVYNIMYGLDVFYRNWQRAPSKSCVPSVRAYTSRTRAAWAAYNGGPAKLCRWTRTRGTYASHDKAFYSKFKNRQWNNYITDRNLESSLDIQCLAAGQRPCSPGSGDGGGDGGSETQQPEQGVLYRNQARQYCVFTGQKYECVEKLDDVNCLQLREGKLYENNFQLSDQAESLFPTKILDRHKLCRENVHGFYPVASYIQLKKRIILRKSPAGAKIVTLRKGQKYFVSDFTVRTTPDQQRYYKVQSGSSVGYIFAGNKKDFRRWAVHVQSGPSTSIAQVGEDIEVLPKDGINIRKTTEGKIIGHLSVGEKALVLETIVRGSKNFVYYKIESQNTSGYIYSGYLGGAGKPGTVQSWTKPVREKTKALAQLSDSKNYSFLRECPSFDCKLSSHIIQSSKSLGYIQELEVLEEKTEWTKVRSLDGKTEGWVSSSKLSKVLD